MTTAYASHTAAPVKGRKWNRKKIILASVVAAVVGLPVAAYAAVKIYGFGQFNSAAATTQGLTVDNATAKLSGSLTPGNTVGAQANVTNPNDFPVTVTAIILRNSTLTVTAKAPAAAGDQTNCEQTVHPVGAPGTWPGTDGGDGTVQAVSSFVTIPAGQTKQVVVPQAVKQDAAGTALCGVHADFAVVAQTAS